MAIIRKFRTEDGSITLEAALIIPILLTFILFLTSLVKISIAELALKEAVSDTAQTVAHYSYLSLVAEKKIQDTTDGFVDDLKNKAGESLGNNEIANELLDQIAVEGKALIPTSGQLINDHAAKSLYEKVVKDKYEEKVGNSDFFSPGTVTIIDHNYPNTRGDSDVVVGAENVLNIVLPFFEKQITIKKVAVERAWSGGE
ncbi:pilus assembly protein [Virgibacillus sp. M23]|uniref:TadE/TadG family type IV pilus assembly protein n=1 Tax=Virgibacillus sp. M23 TaxID=3079030 RepID=UPI002A916A16|nr:TadE family protein [Virgibacillus sp. M23]MDY7045179.1 pilus assembly protein [Virgibacillus sp. M23]